LAALIVPMSVGSPIMDTMICTHEHLECPNHEGSFDCNSFCSICEGNGEYCPDGCEMQYNEDTGDIVYIKENNG
jgi:hypothetical protein